MAEDKEEKGFTVVDRRISLDEEESGTADKDSEEVKSKENKAEPEAKAAPPTERPVETPEETERAQAGQEPGQAPPINFPSFLLSLHTSALIHLGLIPDPVANKQSVDLETARQNIDLLELLQEKTKGNLTNDEKRLLDNILYELRMVFIQVSGAEQKGVSQ